MRCLHCQHENPAGARYCEQCGIQLLDLCPTCGADLNTVTDHSHTEEAIDPRLAALAEWRDGAEPN